MYKSQRTVAELITLNINILEYILNIFEFDGTKGLFHHGCLCGLH